MLYDEHKEVIWGRAGSYDLIPIYRDPIGSNNNSNCDKTQKLKLYSKEQFLTKSFVNNNLTPRQPMQ